MKRKIGTIFVCMVMLVAVFAVAMLMGGSADPRKIYVDDDAPNDPGPNDPAISDPLEDGSLEHPFDTIQEAMDVSNDGDTVHAHAGTYNEEVVISKAIIFEGEDKDTTVIQGSGTGVGVMVKGLSWVTVKDLQVNGFSIGIYLFSSTDNTVSGNTVSENVRYGIYLNYMSHGNTISGNTISSNDLGIRLYSSNTNTISENVVSDNKGGMGLYGSSNDNVISGNAFLDNSGTGISIPYDCDNNVISQNTVADSYIGIYMYASTGGALVDGNDVSDNYFGIYLYRSSSITMVGNMVSDNEGSGFSLHQSTGNTLRWNTVSDNKGGVSFFSSNDNSLYHNNFVDNTNQVGNFESTNTWDDGEGKGNYWSDYEGDDLDGDGVGDTELPHLDVDWYPLMDTWDLVDELMHKTGEVIEEAEAMGLPQGNENSLVSKLEKAIESFEKGNIGAAKGKLNAFINHVESLEEEGKVTGAQADTLITGAQEIIDYL
jgi:parallel beta-helix repeat protein